jgi:hypothetical protein
MNFTFNENLKIPKYKSLGMKMFTSCWKLCQSLRGFGSFVRAKLVCNAFDTFRSWNMIRPSKKHNINK